jgi:uncharacterized protein (DUF1778 family)
MSNARFEAEILELPLSKDTKGILEDAARAANVSLKWFVLDSALTVATEILSGSRITTEHLDAVIETLEVIRGRHAVKREAGAEKL